MAGNRSVGRGTALHVEVDEVKQKPALEVKSDIANKQPQPKSDAVKLMAAKEAIKSKKLDAYRAELARASVETRKEALANKSRISKMNSSEIEGFIGAGRAMKHTDKPHSVFGNPTLRSDHHAAAKKPHASKERHLHIHVDVEKPQLPIHEIFMRELVAENRYLKGVIKEQDKLIATFELDSEAQENLEKEQNLVELYNLLQRYEQAFQEGNAKGEQLMRTNEELRRELNKRSHVATKTVRIQTDPQIIDAPVASVAKEVKADVANVENEQDWDTLSSTSDKATPRASALKGSTFNRVTVTSSARSEEDAVQRHRIGFHGS